MFSKFLPTMKSQSIWFSTESSSHKMAGCYPIARVQRGGRWVSGTLQIINLTLAFIWGNLLKLL